ncbi:MAG: BON domain-containing protein [Candidatus Xenobia bacterium]
MRQRAWVFLAGMGAGAALLYFLDERHGSYRRSVLRDRSNARLRELGTTLSKRRRDLRNRLRGLGAQVRSQIIPRRVDDAVLEARVRSKLGRVSSHPHAIEVTCCNGVCTLGGDVTASEVGMVMSCAGKVRGVRRVDNQMRTRTPGLQPV